MSASVPIDEVAVAIRSRFKEQISDEENLITLHDNDPTVPPENNEWCRLNIRWGENQQREFGGDLSFRGSGALLAQIFVPIGVGDQRALKLANLIMDNFRALDAGSQVTFRTPSINTFGRSGQYWQVNVNCVFFYDFVKVTP